MADPSTPPDLRTAEPLLDLTNALTAASGHEQLLRRRLNRGTLIVDDQTRASLAAIERALDRAMQILHDLASQEGDPGAILALQTPVIRIDRDWGIPAMTKEHHPDQAIRRFDVFAEYTRLERLAKGYPEDEAKGYGIWLAKVVASRQRRSKDDGSASHPSKSGPEPKFRSLNEKLQTDRTFDHDIIDRMGAGFYEDVFAPAIKEAKVQGETYEAIRDRIRKAWKPE